MNDIVAVALKEILSSALAVKEFVLSETPEVIAQLVTWTAMEAWVYLIFQVLLFLTCVTFVLWWCWTTYKDKWSHNDNQVGGAAITMIYMLLNLFTVEAILNNITLLLKLHYAPKVWLLEYMRALV